MQKIALPRRCHVLRCRHALRLPRYCTAVPSLRTRALFKSPYANRYTASRGENGDPKEIRWQSFHSSISYPKLSTEAERAHRRSLRPKSAAPVVQQAAVVERPETPEDLGP